MKCPLCGDQDLVPNFRAGIEIDVCPQCRGVWLDRGELDKLANAPEIPPAAAPAPAPASTPGAGPGPVGTYAPPAGGGSWDGDHGDDRSWEGRPPKRKKAKKRKGFADRLADALDDVLDL
ncbi:MAG: zf-TFIIB domain-containing protein [Actinomycetota bacterium]